PTTSVLTENSGMLRSAPVIDDHVFYTAGFLDDQTVQLPAEVWVETMLSAKLGAARLDLFDAVTLHHRYLVLFLVLTTGLDDSKTPPRQFNQRCVDVVQFCSKLEQRGIVSKTHDDATSVA